MPNQIVGFMIPIDISSLQCHSKGSHGENNKIGAVNLSETVNCIFIHSFSIEGIKNTRFTNTQANEKQAGAELGQAQPKLGLKGGVCILGWRLKDEVEF